MADQKEFKRRLKVLMNKSENLTCVDCNERQPRWASLIKPPPGSTDPMGMGALMCLECSGSHRRLGVHISFVRSVNLDSWKEHEVQIMENGGNAKVNAVYEAHLRRAGVAKPDNTANGQQRERYIRDKYERRKFYDPAALENYEPDDEEEEEQVLAKPARRSTTTKAPIVAPITRAPSEAARRRAEARQARVAAGGNVGPADRPSRINVAAQAPAAPAMDLLDFGSMSSPPAAPPVPPPAAQAPVPPDTNETLDLFANMTVATSAPMPAQKSNADILSLFATPQSHNMMMGGGGQPQMMMGGAQPQMMMGNTNQSQMMMMGGQPQMMMMGGAAQSQGQMNPQMLQQQQQMLMQQQMMQQQMMMMQQGQQQQQGMPQQNMMVNNNTNAMMGSGGGSVTQMNPGMMMMQPNTMHAMMPNTGGMSGGMGMQQQPQQNLMMSMPQANDGGFGMGAAPMGSGPSISALQGQPQKDDPFAQFGFNAFQ